MSRHALLAIAVTIAAAVTLWAAGGARAETFLAAYHRCPDVRAVHGRDRIPLGVLRVSCRTASRLILTWRRRTLGPHQRCIPDNDGFAFCSVDHWQFACQQTVNGQWYGVSVSSERGRGLFRFELPV